MGKNKLAKFADMNTIDFVFQYPYSVLAEKGFPLRGNWHRDFFHNNNPIVIELGCGKGEYTVGLARRFPGRNFIGIDIKGARMWSGADIARRENLGNVAFLRTSIELLESFFAPGEVSEIWITFPDPQMKKATKRLTGTRFVEMYRRLLAPGGIIHLINSGSCTLDATGQQSDAAGNPAMKPFWEISDKEAEACLQATTWYPAGREYMRGGGFSSHFLTRGEMPMTMCRLNLVKGLGPVLQIAEGWAVNVDNEIFEIINKRTDRTWPTTWFAPRLTGHGAFRDVYSVMNNWGANHGAISFGHVGADLATLAAMLRIPVAMHNLDADRLFRPSAWGAFGSDPEGSDYRACATYGPIYK